MANTTCIFCGKLRLNIYFSKLSRIKQPLYQSRALLHIASDISKIPNILKSEKTHQNQPDLYRFLCSLPSTWKKPNGYDTGVNVYNPLANGKVPLILKYEKLLQWYACGPTVYDTAHIGHASSYIRQDIIRRILQNTFGVDSCLVMGITDVDDKIIKRAAQTNQDIGEVTQFYETEFFSDMALLHVQPPTTVVRVTQHIDVIISFISGLEKRGLTYALPDGSIYFDIIKYGKYGVFQDAPESEEPVPDKRNPKDFALWKSVKPGEPSWDSPWGAGRPGWHIECSAMASKVFGSNFDLHSGGVDLMYPHHEDELAQSSAYHGCSQWVNYWLHTGHLHLSGDANKMSKSLNNVLSVPDLLENYTHNNFRMLCLMTHYRKNIEFRDTRLENAASILKSFNNLVSRCDAYLKGDITYSEIPEAEVLERLTLTKKAIRDAYADDFNTPRAVAHVDRFVKYMNTLLEIQPTRTPNIHSNAVMASIKIFMEDWMTQLGIQLAQSKTETTENPSQDFNKAIDILVSARDSVRLFARDKDFFFEKAKELEIPDAQAKGLLKKLYQPLWKITDDVRKEMVKDLSVQISDNAAENSTWSIVERESEETVQRRKEEARRILEESAAKKKAKELKKKKMGQAPQAPNKKEKYKKKKE